MVGGGRGVGAKPDAHGPAADVGATLRGTLAPVRPTCATSSAGLSSDVPSRNGARGLTRACSSVSLAFFIGGGKGIGGRRHDHDRGQLGPAPGCLIHTLGCCCLPPPEPSS